MKIHLHHGYEKTFCGRDAAHLAMTYDEEVTTCTACKQGLTKHRQHEAAEVAAEKAKHEKQFAQSGAERETRRQRAIQAAK